MTRDAERNWAGNLTYRAREIAHPTTIADVQRLVAAGGVRALGSRHSFNDIADTDGALVSLDALEGEIEVGEGTVSVPAGIRYGDLVPHLERAGVALANLASLPHISVAGAVQTGTHGSGDATGALGTQVAAVELVAGTGAHVRLARGDADFPGAVVALGALGIVTRIELDVEPAYEVAQRVFDRARWDAVLPQFDAVTSAGDSVSMFTSWRDADVVDMVWVKSRADRPAPDLAFTGAVPADGPRNPIPGTDPTNATVQSGIPGPWYQRLPHFRLEFTPSVGDELQSEYLVDRADAVAAITALRELAPRMAPLVFTCEVRTMTADELWLSPAYGRDTVAFHFTWHRDEAAVRALLPALEAALPASARPHWGKVFTMDAAIVASRYPRWADFVALRDRLDPDRRLANEFVERLLG